MNLKIKPQSIAQAEKTRKIFFSVKSLSDINPKHFQGNFHKNVVWLSDRLPDPQDHFITIPDPIYQSLIKVHTADPFAPDLAVLLYFTSIIYSFLHKNYHSTIHHNQTETLSKQREIVPYCEISYDFLRSIHHKHNIFINWLKNNGFLKVLNHSYHSKALSKNANHTKQYIPKDGLLHVQANTHFTQLYLPELIRLTEKKDERLLFSKNERLPSSFIINPLRMNELLEEMATYQRDEINLCLKNLDPEMQDEKKELEKIEQKYNNFRTQIAKLPTDSYLLTDKFGNRRHSSITGLPKYIRKYLIDSSGKPPANSKYDGREIMSFDLKASIPSFLSKLVYEQEAINLKEHPDHPSFAEAKLYFSQSTSRLGIYNFIKREMTKLAKSKKIHITMKFTVKDIKSMYIATISSASWTPLHKIRNKQGQLYPKIVTDLFVSTFKTIFPTLFKYLTDMKDKNFKKVTSMLQRHEAEFIHQCQRVLTNHGIPCTTLYDAILLPKQYKLEASNILNHLIAETSIPTKFVAEEPSKVKSKIDLNFKTNHEVEKLAKSSKESFVDMVSKLKKRQFRISGLRKWVLDQAKEDNFEFGLIQRKSGLSETGCFFENTEEQEKTTKRTQTISISTECITYNNLVQNPHLFTPTD